MVPAARPFEPAEVEAMLGFLTDAADRLPTAIGRPAGSAPVT